MRRWRTFVRDSVDSFVSTFAECGFAMASIAACLLWMQSKTLVTQTLWEPTLEKDRERQSKRMKGMRDCSGPKGIETCDEYGLTETEKGKERKTMCEMREQREYEEMLAYENPQGAASKRVTQKLREECS